MNLSLSIFLYWIGGVGFLIGCVIGCIIIKVIENNE